MKILHVSAQLPTRTGSGIYFSSLIEEFNKNNVEQRALYGVQAPFEFQLTEKDYPVVFMGKDITFPIVGMSDVMPYENTRYYEMTEEMIEEWSAAFVKKLDLAIKEFQPDLILAHHLWMLTSLILERYPSIPVYAFCHGTDIRQAKQNPQLLMKYAGSVKKSQKIFALSSLHEEDLIEVFDLDREQIIVTGAGYNQQVFYQEARKEKREEIILVFVGKIDPSKGVFELVKCFDEINKKRGDLYLDIIGSGSPSQKNKLYQLQKKISHIVVYNAEDQAALGDFFRKADILILPSFYEGLGLVALEALASGMRVVATEIDGLMELLGEEVNQSGLIEYVPLPRIQNIDQPLVEDLPQFRRDLVKKIERQIKRVEEEEEVDQDLIFQVQAHSWQALANRIYKILEDSLHF